MKLQCALIVAGRMPESQVPHLARVLAQRLRYRPSFKGFVTATRFATWLQKFRADLKGSGAARQRAVAALAAVRTQLACHKSSSTSDSATSSSSDTSSSEVEAPDANPPPAAARAAAKVGDARPSPEEVVGGPPAVGLGRAPPSAGKAETPTPQDGIVRGVAAPPMPLVPLPPLTGDFAAMFTSITGKPA